jgi:tetratricopeptide (TPR) repeat protein
MKTPNDEFSPYHLQTVVLDLLKDGQRDLAWTLIDYFYEKSTELVHFDVLGYLSIKAEKRETYLKCAENAYTLAKTPEEMYNARMNLVKAYCTMNRPEDALFYVNQILSLYPDDFEAQCQKAFSISLMGEKEKSEEIFFQLAAKYPEKIEAKFASKYLREGKTSKGILLFVENEKPKNILFENYLAMKQWDGSITPGKKLYVSVEGGIGDLIINIRFFDKLSSYGMTPILVSENVEYYNDINNIFRRHNYNVLTDTVLIDRTQKWVPMMSIPGYLGITEPQLWNGKYLKPLKNSKNKIMSNKPKIGIKCTGNPYFSQEEYRKIPIDQMLSVLPKEADIFYIDKNPIEHNDCRVIDMSNKIKSWEDTLDIIDQMDCIVSSCTSLVHAAGAMAKTTFVAVPIAEYYIWTSTKNDGSSPWYGDNFYIARQKKVRDWSEPLADIGDRVHKLLGL